jgi:hypothetical protein
VNISARFSMIKSANLSRIVEKGTRMVEKVMFDPATGYLLVAIVGPNHMLCNIMSKFRDPPFIRDLRDSAYRRFFVKKFRLLYCLLSIGIVSSELLVVWLSVFSTGSLTVCSSSKSLSTSALDFVRLFVSN